MGVLQCTSWWCESLHSLSVNFFVRLFQQICPFHDEWFMSTTTHTVLSGQQFLTKNGVTPVPHPPYSPDLTLNNFYLLPQMKIVLRGKHFVNVEKVKPKAAKALRGIKINEFKNCLKQWGKKVLICILHPIVLWRWLKFKHVIIHTQFLTDSILEAPLIYVKHNVKIKLFIFSYLLVISMTGWWKWHPCMCQARHSGHVPWK